ncbi:phosphatase PAP2 family protein [Fulvivirga sediminis]|uniref:Phosphatase PAP2 family protein n=1 Tax=Fulvivirga sediminis TaxID=2803949 RepID=A0A937F5U8_9BACT|nr:phosphatase PAP2 family protein [Fulvivirga sediminis]MBL3654658.1 phosphatase PAP2 family protein [Fulvivirga sediminis]
MITAYKRLLLELGRHKSEYILFIASLIIPAFICIVSLDVFLEITERMKANELLQFDNNVTDFVYKYRAETTTQWVRFITNLGNAWTYMTIIPIIAALLYYRGHRWKVSIQASIVLATAFLLNITIKHILVRPRPLEAMRLVTAHSYSFPSGHSMSAMAFYGFLVYLTYKYMPNLWVKIALIIVELSLIILIGLSRVYLGVHYPSDVLAGFIAGLFWLIICIVVFKFINFYRQQRAKKLALKKDE